MTARARLVARGSVQGVGFRPFAWALARELGLAGWVRNTALGAVVEIEGPRERAEAFLARLPAELPPPGRVSALEATWLEPAGHDEFLIVESDEAGDGAASVLPDLATCEACLREVRDPSNRRYRHPFANCTHCGPRFTILETIPYDRARTSMAAFPTCSACAREYADPADRRFHAQPIACPACGPQLALWEPSGTVTATRDEALLAAARLLREGATVAVKGLGGFHLACDARDDAAVRRLRDRKHREEKPFALMLPGLAAVAAWCELSDAEARLLASPQAPIVLLRRRAGAAVAPAVAPGNPALGVMLPHSPLHHLLLAESGAPLVATSGNASDEPICTDEREALSRLAGMADAFLVHDRRIVRHADDSIARVMLSREIVLRRGRGYAPLPVALGAPRAATRGRAVLATGAHLKGSVALALDSGIVLSQHLGDLDTEPARAALRRAVDSLRALHRADPALVVADAHPDYASTILAHELGPPVMTVQHHAAHVAACMAENELLGRVLGVAWDGTGLGTDGTIWGGELLMAETDGSFRRVAALRPFRLPGGDVAAREPRRSAVGVLHAMEGGALLGRRGVAPCEAFLPSELRLLVQALDAGLRAPWTTSAGRLFDAAASLCGLRQRSAFEGQAAMLLEWACDDAGAEAYPMPVSPVADWPATPAPGHPAAPPQWVVDWAPAFTDLLHDVERGVPAGTVSARFHAALAGAIVEVARLAGEERVVLTGGCFQNRVLTEAAVTRLRAAGFSPSWHQRVPPNDGGIAAGQAALGLRRLARAST